MRFDAAHRIVATIVVLAIFLAQTLPMAASHSAGGGGDWIVICSDDGAKLIQLDDTDPKQGECNHCSFCLISSNTLQGDLTPYLAILMHSNFTNISFGRAQTIGLTGPEQYWSACRGPPIASIDNKMTTLFSLLIKEQVQVVSNAWSTPCL